MPKGVYFHYTLFNKASFVLFLSLVLLLPNWLLAQECLPDPRPALFFEDFGSGMGRGEALPAGTTTFTYGSIETNHYIVSNTTSINPNFWHEGFDHTDGDTNGYMLLFNAADAPRVFYQRSFTNLCPNTNYIFSGFFANIVLPVACIGDQEKPNVQMTVINPVDSSIMVSESTKTIFFKSFLTWEEHSIHFRTGPAQTEVFLRLSNNGRRSCGNDLAIDDLSLRLCNVQVQQSFDLCDLPGGSIRVGENTYTEPGTYFDVLPIPNSCNDTLVTTTLTGTTRVLPTIRYTFCQGDTLEIRGQQFGENTSFVDTLPGPIIDCPTFQPYEIIAQTRQVFEQTISLCHGESFLVGSNTYTTSGVYIDSLISQSGCDSIVMTTITTGAIEVEVSPSSVETVLGQRTQLSSTVSFSDEYTLSWQPAEVFSCTDCPDPLLEPSVSGTFQVIATDLPSGCTDSATVTVSLQECDQVFIPNAFSPNADGVNDRLEVFTAGCFTNLAYWRIFDRWGALVYEVQDQPLMDNFVGWDGQVNGQAAAEGVYGYQLILELERGMQKIFRGEVLLVR